MSVILIAAEQCNLACHIAETLRFDGHDLRLLWQSGSTEDELDHALQGVDAVIHLASSSQPLDRILPAMTRAGTGNLVLGSSLEVYGEGLYADPAGHLFVPEPRSGTDVEAGRWHLADEEGRPYTPLPTPETALPMPFSATGRSALQQENLAAGWAEEQDRQIAILRLGPVFGPPAPEGSLPDDEIWRMLAAASAGQPVPVAEDGGQVRDWLHVRNAARAFGAALHNCDRKVGPINIASGQGYSGDEVVALIASAVFNYDLLPAPNFLLDPQRPRHLVGTIDLARNALGFEPLLPLANSLGEMTMLHRGAGI